MANKLDLKVARPVAITVTLLTAIFWGASLYYNSEIKTSELFSSLAICSFILGNWIALLCVKVKE